ncbi:hypothetical protein HUT17_04760 (plasmid) [Nocardiopsis flavescens]|nr:hypothetical protein HUT17_04760 [Nocardiopsis flavescens]
MDPTGGTSVRPTPPGLAVVHEVVLVAADRQHEHATITAAALLAAVAEPDESLLVRAARPAEDLAQRQVVVVAPSTARGLADASALISTWRPALAQPGLLIVRDAPLPPPRIVVQRAHALADRVQISEEIPYLHRLRLVDEPAHALQGKGRDVARTRRRLRNIRRRLYTATFLAAGGGPGEPVPSLTLDTAPSPSTSVPTSV